MEKLNQQVDAVVIPVGGGGLLAGMSVTLKHLLPHVRVIVSRAESARVLADEGELSWSICVGSGIREVC